MSTPDVGIRLRGCAFASVVFAVACSSSPKGSGGSAGGGAGTFGGGGDGGGAGTSGIASQTVGTQGGTVTLDGVTLTVPGNALSEDTVVTVSTTTAPAGYIIASAAYQLAPTDAMFVQAVTVTIPLTMTAPRAHLFLSNGSGGYEDRGGIVSGPIITAQVTHFGTCFAATPSVDGGAVDVATDGAVAKDGGDAASGADAIGKDGGAAGASGGTAGAGTAGAGTAGSGAAGAGTAGAGAGTAGSGAAGAGTAGSGGQTDAGQTSDASDAGASSEAGTDAAASPLCAATGINAPGVTVTNITDDTPVPAGSTYTGGTISSGTYYLTSVTHYGGSDYTGPQKSVHVFDASAQTLRVVESMFLQGMVSYSGFSLSNSDDHTLQASVICSSAQASTISWYYTISGSTMTMSQVGSVDVAVYTAGL